ncbi:hypothetical protein [Acidovorax sp. 106]|uniref:hypothetical protein n=1 Tax=Acidovorax sp. 106 TaxID=2135637 RepID=UPI000EAFE102|nr:hypothetical protein [Acidovorax sp. 106]RLJ38896.1 hypothetical protein C8C98_2629 [Acidovorax sp. 106]
MQVITLTLERVFDIQRREATRFIPKHTHFSFESEGRLRYTVQVPGWPSIEAGHTLTALLEKPDNWQTLVGWKNSNTNELAFPDEQHLAFFSGAAGICAATGWLLTWDEPLPSVLWIFTAIFTLCSVAGIARWLQLKKKKACLLSACEASDKTT